MILPVSSSIWGRCPLVLSDSLLRPPFLDSIREAPTTLRDDIGYPVLPTQKLDTPY